MEESKDRTYFQLARLFISHCLGLAYEASGVKFKRSANLINECNYEIAVFHSYRNEAGVEPFCKVAWENDEPHCSSESGNSLRLQVTKIGNLYLTSKAWIEECMNVFETQPLLFDWNVGVKAVCCLAHISLLRDLTQYETVSKTLAVFYSNRELWNVFTEETIDQFAARHKAASKWYQSFIIDSLLVKLPDRGIDWKGLC